MFEKHLAETMFVGEVGLDGSPELRSSQSDQIEVFERVLRLCAEAGDKVLSIHSRRAAGAVLDSLEKFGTVRVPVLHWFSGTHAELRRAVDRGCWFSVGPAMLKGSKGRALVLGMPKNRILLETDGPFAQVNRSALHPWDVAAACQALADLWGVNFDDAESVVLSNERSLLSSITDTTL
ncbi:TatD-related deoxyribonuclease [Mycolicibacterium phlei RIVM601174]|nr:TatD-related deoxyribonuclease [Mycolicibacterium phlei RIVM601174]MBF4195678.1 TatD-related deoxyribonuclease [Mycolicibacterium phlei]